MTKTVGVLLAAGAGTRLGKGPKALLPYCDSTLVERASAALLDAGCSEIMVVTGAGAERVADLQASNSDFARCQLLFNTHWESGMGSSFRLGVEAAVALAAQNVVVALVDQPSMSSAVVLRVLSAHKTGRITAAAYVDAMGKQQRGHPVVFDATLAQAAASLAKDDAGARLFLRANPKLVDLVDCSDLSDGSDLDTPADLWRLDSK